MRTPIHKDRGGGRRASALRAENSLRRRKAFRQRQGDSTRHVAAMAEKFHAPKFHAPVTDMVAGSAANFASAPEILRPADPVRPPIAPPSQHYMVLYFALAVTSVLAAAQAHSGGQRARPSLIALMPQTMSRAVTEPPRTSLRVVSFQDVTVLTAPGPPALTGLAALRETIQSRQVDVWPELGPGAGPVPVSGADTNRSNGRIDQDTGAPTAVIDDEFGSGLRAPGICELPDGLESAQPRDAPPAQTFASLSTTPLTQVSEPEFGAALAAAAQRQTSEFTVYTDKYRRMSYPMGDVPALFGVCTDVIIRAYRALGVDLQALIHIARIGPSRYQHRSPAHLHVAALFRVARRERSYQRVCRRLSARRHRHLSPSTKSRFARSHRDRLEPYCASGRPMIVHNRGWGPQIEDALFVDKITGHYRYRGPDGSRTLDAGAEAKPGQTSTSSQGQNDCPKSRVLPRPRASRNRAMASPKRQLCAVRF